jgi:hypothetical protein
VPAAEAERDPVAERLASLLLDPVPLRLCHGQNCRRRAPPAEATDAVDRVRPRQPDDGRSPHGST